MANISQTGNDGSAGNGGTFPGGTGGGGGAGTAQIYTLNGNATDTTNTNSETGGAGGNGGFGGVGTNSIPGGNGGPGGLGAYGQAITYSTANNTSATVVSRAISAGGAGGAGGPPGPSGGAGAGKSGNGGPGGDGDAAATTTNTLGGAEAYATATGGAGSTEGTAQATATAQSGNGQLATAAATAVGSSDTGQTTANALFAGLVTNVTASTNTSGAGTQTSQSEANVDGDFPTVQGSTFSAYAFASGLPNTSQVDAVISANSNINAKLGSSNTHAVILGYGTEGSYATSASSGTQTLTSSQTYTLNAAGLSGNLILGLASPQSGSGFTSLTITTKVGGATIAAGTQTVSTLTAAQTFFTNDAINLGTFSATNGLTVQITETLTTSTLGNGFGDEIVLGVTGAGALCFCAGTRILTATDERTVESLAQGDTVLTLSDRGLHPRTVKWLGWRRIDIAAHPRPELVAPIRIRRGAVADSMPHSDLLVSPDHAILLDGKLICARQLVNGTTIRQEYGVAAVEYFHIELDTHAILLAEGLPAESYLDTGNRGFFSNADAPRVLYPDLTNDADAPTREAASCAPFVWDEADVRPVWQRLADRATALGQPIRALTTTTAPDLRVVAKGRMLQPIQCANGLHVFVLPQGTTEARVVSRAGLPTEARPWLNDSRRLGVYVMRIVLRTAHEVRDIPLDHPALSQGWWAVEQCGTSFRRWTNGDAALPLPAFDGIAMLEVHAGSCGMEYAIDAVACPAA